ncbi:SRPBCC family protein [Nocardioides limicola]|uniref:SRPBCC family protein n=1 Tax=Nocardioides limicola TaxID=2803368 RepID=UPI00193B58D3|nr:SRPBCC family protein [Nocardioides sp. DJM-14]
MTASYSFSGSWLLPAPAERVHAVLLDLQHYPSWWPQVRAVAKIDDDRARVLCRSALPYTLDLTLTATRRDPDVLESDLTGDLIGEVRWRLVAETGGTRLLFEQEVEVASPLLSAASRLLRPVLVWNHDRMLAGGIEGLRSRVGQRA